MSNKIFIIFLSIILLVFGILVVFVFDVNCVFKIITGLSCPGCGLTRSFRFLFSGHIIMAIKYNILTIPIFIFLLAFGILLVIDIFLKTNYLDILLKKLTKHYKIILLLVLLSFIINNIRGI